MNEADGRWDVHDPAFEAEIRADRVAFANEFRIALSSGQLADVSPPANVAPLNHWQWQLGVFYLRSRLGWKVGDVMQFNLPGGMAYTVTLEAIDPITPLLKPDRGKGQVRYGWALQWAPDSVRKLASE